MKKNMALIISIIFTLCVLSITACSNVTPETTVRTYVQALENEDADTIMSLEASSYEGAGRQYYENSFERYETIISELEVNLVSQTDSTAKVTASYHFEAWREGSKDLYRDYNVLYTLTNSGGKWLISSKEDL